VNPAGFAAACLEVAAREKDVDIHQQELAKVANVSTTTVRKHRNSIQAELQESEI
jgi:transcription initiation factor TFIIB